MNNKGSHFDGYHKLTPVDNVDLGEYENALLFALSEDDVRNVAITGVYGSGKSSLIKTFEAKHAGDKRFNFLNVSLASFVIESNPNFENEKISTQSIKKNETQDIEKSLLQQIIFKVKSDALEDSQFSRIKIKRYYYKFLTSNFWSAFFVVSLLLSISFVFFKPDFFPFKESWLFNEDYILYFELIVLIGVLGLIQLALNLLPKLGFSKLSAAGAEISFNEKRGDSILNKHLDELIYFFATTRFNVVVFEDLDRLPIRDILIKLREINQLLNNSEEINKHGQRKVIKFVFALGDDLFSNVIDRTKFFDFIIPVIPLVNFSNSRQKLEEAIRKAFPQIEFRNNFLDEVTQFLDDMRLLFNVANEFIIYKKRLDAEHNQSSSKDKLKLDSTKLLALIIYKNKYPEDFAKLNQREGKVWDVLMKKEMLIEATKTNITNQIDEIKKQILALEAEKLVNADELRRSYVGYYLAKYPELHQFTINNTNYLTSQLFQNDSLFEQFRSQSNTNYLDARGYQKPMDKFSNIEKEIHSQLSYQQRKELLAKQADGSVSALNSKIAAYEKELGVLQGLSLSQTVVKQPELAFDGLDVEDGLIKYLIIEGLIGEDFVTYTTYFYPGELSSNDQQYLMSILSNTPLDVAYKLDNPEKVFEKIKEESFKRLAIFNLDLLTFSLSKRGTRKFTKLVETIIDSKELGSNLLKKWLAITSLDDDSKQYLLNKITKQDEYFWSKLVEDIELTKDEKDNLLILLLKFLDDVALQSIKQIGFIQQELKANVDLLNSLTLIGYEKLEKLFKNLNIVFSNIAGCDDSELLAVIERTNAYEITIENLTKILSRTNQATEVVPTYSYILQNGSESTKKYIKRELRWFADSVLQNLQNAEEQESSALALLESGDLESELKVSLIQNLRFKIKDIETVTDQALWPELFNSKRVEATWGNVIKYFTVVEKEFDQVLIRYFNDQENVISLTESKLKHNVPDESELARKIIGCNDLNDDSYGQLTKSIAIRFNDLSEIEISENKLEVLLSTGKFAVTVKNHEFLNSSIPEKSYLMIERYFDEFIQRSSEIAVTNDELISLISASKLSDSQKSELLKITPDSSYDDNLAKVFCEFILGYKNYLLIDVQLIKKILSFSFGQDLKIRLFNRYSDRFDHSTILDVISNMPITLSKLVKNKHAILIKNDENTKFAEFLKSKGYVSSYKDYKKNENQIELIPSAKKFTSS